ncbi:MAG TPA: PEP-CTERM sorting domain-containing protein [Steroidobacteraceae bacterium]|nr:PEP-CTERM sorting domain-containing protein [Steroidobacteraceae bacterium]
MSTSFFRKWVAAAALLGAATAAQASFIAVDGGTAPKSTINIVPANDFLDDLADHGVTKYTLGASLATDVAGYVTYYYYGKEAGYTNRFSTGGLSQTTGYTQSESFFDNPWIVGWAEVGAGLLDFRFCAYDYTSALQGCVSNAQNNNLGLYSYQSIAMSIAGDTAWLFWDDSGAGPDDNHDDMLIRAVFSTTRPVPEPGTLALFGLGLLGIGLARRRSKHV